METIILFYKYVAIRYPKQMLKWQTKLCTELNLKGRIVLAHEGINGTLVGSELAIERYKKLLSAHQLFADIDFKQSSGPQESFAKLQIKVKNEIVHLGIDSTQLTPAQGGTHLKSAQVHALLAEQPDDLVVFDARNKYESAIGAFKGAITPDISYFRQLPAYIDAHLDTFKNKKVLMYCTGGVRCERASAYLKQKGVAQEVYQLEGGIHRYLEQFPDGYFRGKNYVFDGRISVATNADVLGVCALCAVSCDEYNNCLNASCNKQYICCDACLEMYSKTCSERCKTLVLSRAVPLRPALCRIK